MRVKKMRDNDKRRKIRLEICALLDACRACEHKISGTHIYKDNRDKYDKHCTPCTLLKRLQKLGAYVGTDERVKTGRETRASRKAK